MKNLKEYITDLCDSAINESYMIRLDESLLDNEEDLVDNDNALFRVLFKNAFTDNRFDKDGKKLNSCIRMKNGIVDLAGYNHDLAFEFADDDVKLINDMNVKFGDFGKIPNGLRINFITKQKDFTIPTFLLPKKITSIMIFVNGAKYVSLDLTGSDALSEIMYFYIRQLQPASPRAIIKDLIWHSTPVDYFECSLQFNDDSNIDLGSVNTLNLGKTGMQQFVKRASEDPLIVKKILGSRCSFKKYMS